MAASKLFTPRLHDKPGAPLDREERASQFMNPPTHAEVPVFKGPTNTNGYPLRMAPGDSQQHVATIGRRRFITAKRGDC